MKEGAEVTRELLAEKFKTKTLVEWTEIFKETDACVSPVLSLDEAPLHPHNVERKSFVKVPSEQDGGGSDSYLPTMNWLSGMSPEDRSYAIPKNGQHTLSILKELGYDEKTIERFLSERIAEQHRGSSATKSKL